LGVQDEVMDSNYVDTSRLPGRHMTEGPGRAPHRSHLCAMARAGRKSSSASRDITADSGEFNLPSILIYGGKYAQPVDPVRFGALTNPGARGEKE
jgi:hypothetical protein